MGSESKVLIKAILACCPPDRVFGNLLSNPHMNIFENLAFGIPVKYKFKERKKKVLLVLEKFGADLKEDFQTLYQGDNRQELP